MLRRSPRLTEVADVASFLASDRAATMTGTIANATCGLVPGKPWPGAKPHGKELPASDMTDHARSGADRNHRAERAAPRCIRPDEETLDGEQQFTRHARQ